MARLREQDDGAGEVSTGEKTRKPNRAIRYTVGRLFVPTPRLVQASFGGFVVASSKPRATAINDEGFTKFAEPASVRA